MTYRHILVPTDGSEISERAVEQAVSLAAALGARGHAIARGRHTAAAMAAAHERLYASLERLDRDPPGRC